MRDQYDHTVSDFEVATSTKRKNLRRNAAELAEIESNEKILQKLHIDKHAVTTVDDIVQATDEHPEEVMNAFDAWANDTEEKA